jgi:hypothetical protein
MVTRRRKKTKAQYSKCIVAFCVAATTLFTIAVLFVSLQAGEVPPDSLIVGFFTMYGVELACCAGIKVSDNRKDGNDE